MFLTRPLIEVGAAAEKREGNPIGKYETYNFLKGLSVADTLDCLHRHLDSVIDPTQPDIDKEDNCHHLAKVAWNALVALHFINTRPDLDDRYKIDNLFDEPMIVPKGAYDILPGGISIIEYSDNKHNFKFEKLDIVIAGSEVCEVLGRYYNEDFIPVYMLRTTDAKVFEEKEDFLTMAKVDTGE